MEAKVPISVYAESTPNPDVMKFVCNRVINPNDSVEFKNIEEAQIAPLCVQLFNFPFVKEVFLARNFISITKYNIIEWEDIVMEVREFVREYVAEGKTVINEQSESVTVEASEKSTLKIQEVVPETELEQKIVDILEEYVRPAVEADGGNISFRKYDHGIVTVALQGACSGCPSASVTLKQGIETMLKQMLPGQIEAVIAEEI
jgi:Fe-S cluster biogenesis protein NfuA